MTSFVVLLHRLCIILKYLFKFDVYVLSPTKVKLKLWNRVLVIAELTGRLNTHLLHLCGQIKFVYTAYEFYMCICMFRSFFFLCTIYR